MKKVLLALTALSLTFGACQKNTSTLPPVTDTVYIDSNAGKEKIDTSVTIAGIKDIRMNPWGMFTLPITVNRNVGESQKVSMMISGVPANVKAKFSAETGYTSFNTNLMIESMFQAPGTYPITIASSSAMGKTVDYTVNLVVDSVTKKESNDMFISSIINTLSYKDTMRDSVVYMGSNLYLHTLENELYIRNMLLHYDDNAAMRYYSFSPTNSSYQVKFMYDGNTGELTIPQHEVQGRSATFGNMATFTVSGKGKVNPVDGTFYIMFTTSFDDGGNIVTSHYTAMGSMQ